MSRFPDDFGSHGDMPAIPLVEAVKRVALVAERGSSVRLSFGHGKVTIEAGTEGQARARETVAADFAGEETAIAFSPHYLMDGLGAALIAAVRRPGQGPGTDKAQTTADQADRPADKAQNARQDAPSPTRRGSACSSPARPSPPSSPAARERRRARAGLPLPGGPAARPGRRLTPGPRPARQPGRRAKAAEATRVLSAHVRVAGHPGHDQDPGGQREQQHREDEEPARVRGRDRQRRGSDLAGLGGRGRSAVSRSIWRCVLAMRAASIRSVSSSKVSRPATKCSRSWAMATSRSASPILRS